jgi:hypothetical protein
MKTPEKIYIQPNAHDRWFEVNLNSYMFVEYVHKDAFIKKAEEWLRNNQQGFILTDKDITDFINDMKGK